MSRPDLLRSAKGAMILDERGRIAWRVEGGWTAAAELLREITLEGSMHLSSGRTRAGALDVHLEKTLDDRMDLIRHLEREVVAAAERLGRDELRAE